MKGDPSIGPRSTKNLIGPDNSHSHILSRRLGICVKCRPFDLRSKRLGSSGMRVLSFSPESFSTLLHGRCTGARRVSVTHIVASYFTCKTKVFRERLAWARSCRFQNYSDAKHASLLSTSTQARRSFQFAYHGQITQADARGRL